MASGKFKKIGPSISLGMMKKLEPVLNFKKRATCGRDYLTVKPLNAPQQQTKNQSKDEFCFPSSPKNSKDEHKKAKKLSKKAEKKAKTIMKVRMAVTPKLVGSLNLLFIPQKIIITYKLSEALKK